MKKVRKDVRGFIKVGVGLGIGTGIVAGAGGNVGGLSTMSGMMRPVAMASMGKHTIRMLKKYDKLYKRKYKY